MYKKIELTQEEADKAYAFAVDQCKHVAHGRNEKQVIDNIYTGKLAEIAFSKALNTSSPKWDGEVDPGYDFIVDDRKIDVKSTDIENPKLIFLTSYTLNNADDIVFCKVNKEHLEVDIIGKISTKAANALCTGFPLSIGVSSLNELY